MRRRPVAGDGSFTLVELLAATTVLALLMVALVGMFDQAMRGWQNAQRGIEARREVRAALQFLESDLRGMVVETNWPIFNRVDDANQSSRLTFVTVLGTNAQAAGNPGDLCAVQYLVEFTNNRYRLIRRLQMSGALFSNLTVTGGPTGEDDYMAGNPVREELAQNVVYFRSELKFFPDISYQPLGAVTNKPHFVQMELTAYPQQVAQGFTQASDWTRTNTIQRYGKTYLWRTAP